MKALSRTLLAAAALAVATPAFAADLLTTKAPAAAPAPAPTTTITLEGSPEFSAATGNLSDDYVKGTISYTFAPGWSVSGAVQDTVKNLTGTNTYQYQVEGAVAYKAKLSDMLSLSGTAGLGYTTGNTGYVGGVFSSSLLNNDSFLYYFVSGAADLKLDSNWTWNAINVRYRNAFTETWITPKISTGITYNIDSTHAVYANVGYAWKDKGDGKGLVGDKYNVAVGYKFSF